MAKARKKTTTTKKPAKPAKPAAGKRATTPQVKVDANLKKRWEAEFERYQASRTHERAGWDERYEALGVILEEELYLGGGYKSEREFLVAEVADEDERSVRRAIRVARSFDPDDEERYGITKLDLLLDYLEAVAGAQLPPAKLRLEKLTVTVQRDKKDRKVLFAEVTTTELAAATRAAKGKSGKTQKAASPAVKALRGALRTAKLHAVAVSERGGKLFLSNIEASDVARLGKALAAARLPVG